MIARSFSENVALSVDSDGGVRRGSCGSLKGTRSPMSLKPTDPETAVDWYLKDRANELADSSLKSHEYQLKRLD
jgi:hypothetical protein